MKLRNLLSIFFLASAGLSQAAEPVAQLFVAMPDSLVPSIEVNRRKDLIDLFHAGQKAQVDNKLGGTTSMTLLQDNGLTIDLSQQSQMALHLYTTPGNDTLIALVNTVYGPAADSRIRFFDSSWMIADSTFPRTSTKPSTSRRSSRSNPTSLFPR